MIRDHSMVGFLKYFMCDFSNRPIQTAPVIEIHKLVLRNKGWVNPYLLFPDLGTVTDYAILSTSLRINKLSKTILYTSIAETNSYQRNKTFKKDILDVFATIVKLSL